MGVVRRYLVSVTGNQLKLIKENMRATGAVASVRRSYAATATNGMEVMELLFIDKTLLP